MKLKTRESRDSLSNSMHIDRSTIIVAGFVATIALWKIFRRTLLFIKRKRRKRRRLAALTSNWIDAATAFTEWKSAHTDAGVYDPRYQWLLRMECEAHRPLCEFLREYTSNWTLIRKHLEYLSKIESEIESGITPVPPE